jgi:hypothetical protein
MSTRPLLAAGLLLLATLSVAPMAAASIDNVYACVGLKEDQCDHDKAVLVNVKADRVDACVIGVAGSCDPYQGDLVRVTYTHGGEVQEQVVVPDPCYTTACF